MKAAQIIILKLNPEQKKNKVLLSAYQGWEEQTELADGLCGLTAERETKHKVK